MKIELYEREKMICLFFYIIKLFNFFIIFVCVLFNVDGDWLKYLFYLYSDFFLFEVVKYCEEMMRMLVVLIYLFGVLVSYNEGILFIK